MRMRRVVIAALCLALSPTLAFAAGFAPQSIFLSKLPVTEGDTVRIYAIVANSSSDTFSGKVVLSEGGSTIGTVPVSLAAGATQAANVVWRPLAGSHAILATITSTTGSVVETKSETFVVNPKPKPADVAPVVPQPAAAVESSAGIQQSIENVSPPVASAAKPVFNAIDGVRQAIANVADQQLANVKPKVANVPLPGQVEGLQTEAPSPQAWYWAIFYTIYFYILTLARFLVGSAGVFYPVIAILFLYFMWKMFRKFRRA